MAVTLGSFSAAPQGNAVEVTWDTVSESDTAGFNLYRDSVAEGPGVKLNSKLIPARQPGSAGGSRYSYMDRTDLAAGATLYYWLEDVSLTGVTARSAPVSVTAAGPTAIRLTTLRATGQPGQFAPAGGLVVLGMIVVASVKLRRYRRRT